MSAQLKPRHTLTPETRAELDRIAAEVQLSHELRQDRCDELPLRRRGRRVKRQPSTAVLMRAINKAAEKRGTSVVGLHKLLYGKAPT